MPDSPLAKRLIWSGIVAACGAAASLAASRAAVLIYKRLFGEDPPE